MYIKKIIRIISGALAVFFIVAAPPAVCAAEQAREDEAYIIDVTDHKADGSGGAVSRDISAQPLTEQAHPPSIVAGLELPPSYYPNTFTIKLATSIGKIVRYVTNDNVLALDFYDAKNSLQEQYEVDHPVVERIRAGSFADGTGTRVVFDLKSAVDFTISLTPDRRSLSVAFIKNNVRQILFYGDGVTDIVRIEGDYPPVIILKPNEDTGIVVVDIPFTNLELPAKWLPALNFIKIINTEQIDEHTARVTMQTRGAASMEIEYGGNAAIVSLSPATYRNISYSGKILRLRKDPLYPANLSAFVTRDDYNNYKYTVTLDGGYQEWLGWGNYYINDEFLKSVRIDTNAAGAKQLTFFGKHVLACELYEDGEYVFIKIMRPKEKYSRIAVVDAGHGGPDPGARGNGLTEKNLNLDVSKRVLALAENGPVKIYATRTTDVIMDLYDRPRWANAVGDLFVSIHMNAMGGGGASAGGTEVYYLPHDNDGAIGFSGYRLANILQNKLLAALGSIDRKVKSANFAVLRNAKIPAALVEVGFVTNREEASKLSSENYRQKAAQAIYDGILESFNNYAPSR